MSTVADGDDGHTGPEATRGGFASSALSGSVLSTVQTVLNKVVTLFAMWLIARLLSPEQVGLANVAVTVGAFLLFISPTGLGDVLLADPRRFDGLSGAARRLAYAVGVSFCLLLVVLAYPIEWMSGTVGIGSILVFVALRPLADAALVVPSARMRLDLRYRQIVLVDGSAMLTGTTMSVLFAWLGAGPVSIVLPPIMALGIRAMLYTRFCRGRIERTVVPGAISGIASRFVIAAVGQYAHGITGILEPLVLWAFASRTEQGYFALAFQFAVQANAVLYTQFTSVLQPIFSHLSHDVERQGSAFLRALRITASVLVPVSLVQASVAEPLFRLLFEPEWSSSIGVFFALSLAQASVFAVTLSFTMLKAQGRFKTGLVWQIAQAVVSAGAFAISAEYGSAACVEVLLTIGVPIEQDAARAVAIAVASSVMWGISSIVGVVLCGSRTGIGIVTATRIILRPWIVTAPFMAVTMVAWNFLERMVPDPWSSILTLFVVAPLVLVAAILVNALTDRRVRADFLTHGRKVVARVLPGRLGP
jgi:O-antigen/teichoic acid export membrane protein